MLILLTVRINVFIIFKLLFLCILYKFYKKVRKTFKTYLILIKYFMSAILNVKMKNR